MSIIITGVGRIGKDAVTREAGSDKVTGFSLAMDNGFGDKKQTLWFDCSGWGKRYESVAAYLLKGSQVFVTGELGEREHEGKTYKTLRLLTLDLVGGKPAERQPTQRDELRGDNPPRDGLGRDQSPDFPQDDIPF